MEEEPVEEWEQVIDVIDRIDRMVDVLNARWDRGAEQIDLPQHKYIFELFSVLQMFEEWKDDVGGFTFEFITRQTYEDLQWMIFSVVGISCKYLDLNKSKKTNQKRGGTDVCEYCFCKN